MSLDDKYNNYIYFFNSPNDIKLQSGQEDAEPVDFQTGLAAISLADLLTGLQDDYQFKIVASAQPDIPAAESSTPRAEEKLITEPVGVKNYSFPSEKPFVNSRDPLNDPHVTPVFKVEDQRVKYDFLNEANLYQISYQLGANEKPVYSFTDYNNKNLNRSLKTVVGEKYKFTQDDYITYYWSDPSTPKTVINDVLDTFFTNYYGYMATFLGQTGRGEIVDITTRMGVPFDFQASLNEKTDLKVFGVKNTQPKYDKIYNYYDPQYERAAVEVINQSVVDERSLPSVYDFLYLPVQGNALRSFIGLPGFGINTDLVNLSNLNQYLDTFSSVYEEYINPDIEKQTSSQLAAKYFYKGGGAKLAYGADGKDFQVAPKHQSAQVAPADTDKLPSVKAQMLKNINTGFGATNTIVNDKKDSVPLWIQEAKTGIYFTEKSLNYFNQAFEYDNAFPFLIKINIPTDEMGPIGKLFSEYDLLDSINSYAASLVVPNDELPDSIRTYSDFYGGLINGSEGKTKNFNYYQQLKLQTFKLHFYNTPEEAQPITTEQEITDAQENFGQFFENNPSPVQQEAAAPGPTLNLPAEESETEGEFSFEAQASFSAGDVQSQQIIDTFTDAFPADKVFYDSDLFINTFKDISLSAAKNVFIYTDNPDKLKIDNESFSAMIEQIKGDLFTKKLNELLTQENLLRSPREVRQGKFAHEETLMYEIAKYSIDDLGNENYIQSIFLPITNQDNLSYYDTQIIPYKNYFYKIFTHKVIVGTKYKMVPASKDNIVEFLEEDGFPYIKVKYNVEPVFQFVRVPFYNTDEVNLVVDELNYTRVEDKPPLPPEVEIVPFRNINDKVLIMLTNAAGETKAYPRPIFDEDKDIFTKIALSQDKNYGDMLTFRSDDQGGTFEVFRTQNKPLYYTDIGQDETLITYESSDSILDDIKPNINYYYTFRYVDVHDKISNPSYVYKVLMVQSPGTPPYLKV